MSNPPVQPVIRRCPICRKPRDPALSPFCSSRCRDRDLVNWLEGGYALPGPGPNPDSDPDTEA